MVLIFTISILTASCKDRGTGVHDNSTASGVSDSSGKSSSRENVLTVSANLVYEDETISSFDVLNDKSKVLWNTPIGAGDASKPSDRTRVNFIGSIDSLDIKIRNGKKTVLDTLFIKPAGRFEYTLTNTGCEQVYVTVIRNLNILYNDSIPFHCGE